jgi:cell division protein FtsI/penicillin-binding protein 2
MGIGVRYYTTKSPNIPKSENTRSIPEYKVAGEQSPKNDGDHETPLYKYSFDDLPGIINASSWRFSSAHDTINYRWKKIVVHYSLDSDLVAVINTYMKRYHPRYGAAVVLEPGTGRVLALVSYTREGEPVRGDNLYCSATFPAASIFKIVTTTGAIEKMSLGAQSIIKVQGANHTLYQSQLQKDLSSIAREVTLEEAFAYSINPAFARLGLFYIGSKGLGEYAEKFGFNERIPFELKTEKAVFVNSDSAFTIAELASGFNEQTTINPLFGALMAAAVSNHGRIFAPTLVDSITNAAGGGKQYQRRRQLWKKPIEPRTAEEMVVLMKKVAQYGTARKGFRYVNSSYQFDSVDYGGKTGSVDKNGVGRVDWFLGFCRDRLDPGVQISIAIVTVHDENWTIHSSFIGAETMRRYMQLAQAKKKNLTMSVERFRPAAKPF